ncbi:MAG: flagellar biosynthetic protein FliQ [Candidatus Midichloriaceae bacterium]|jgi:flagellar biosynthetic protein FliQ
MDPNTILQISYDTLMVILKISLPLLLTALATGVTISLIQALTQIQEPTISFIPKIISVFIVLLFTMNYIGSIFSDYMERLTFYIININ